MVGGADESSPKPASAHVGEEGATGAGIVWHGNEDLRPLLTPLASLTEDDENARIHPKRNLRTIAQSLVKFGQFKPLVGWLDAPNAGGHGRGMIVMCGNGTLSQIRALGWTHVAVSVFKGSRVDARAMALVDNLASDFAEWNEELKQRQIEECSAAWTEEVAPAVPEPVLESVAAAPASHAAAASHALSLAGPEAAPPPRAPAPVPTAPATYARTVAEKIASIPEGPQRIGLIDSQIRRVIKKAAERAHEHVSNHDAWDTGKVVEALADEEV